MAQSLVHNVVAKGALSIFNTLLPLIVTPYVYRILGPQNMGDIEYATTFFSYFGMLGMLGIYQYGLREISANRLNLAKVQTIYKNLFSIGIVSNIVCLSLYMLFIFVFIENPAIKTISYILCGNLVSQIFYVEWVNEAFEEFKFITLKTMIIRILSVIIIFTCIKSTDDALIYAAITVGVAIANYFVSYVHAAKAIKLSFKETFSGLNFKAYIVPLLTILVLNNTGALYTVIDRALLGYTTGTENVAFFTIGLKIVELTNSLLLAVVFATLPRLSLYLKEDKQLYQAGILKIMRLVLALIIPAGIGMLLLSEQIIWLFGGTQYGAAVPAMRIFSLRIIIMGIETVLYSQIIFLHGKEKRLVFYNFLCGVLNVALNLAFLPVLDPFVSISCTAIAEVSFTSLCLVYIHRKLKIDAGIFELSTLKYLTVSLLFIPVVLAVRSIGLSHLYMLVVASSACVFLYFSILALQKDTIYLELKSYASKIFNR